MLPYPTLCLPQSGIEGVQQQAITYLYPSRIIVNQECTGGGARGTQSDRAGATCACASGRILERPPLTQKRTRKSEVIYVRF
jgi:hypothetical protein